MFAQLGSCRLICILLKLHVTYRSIEVYMYVSTWPYLTCPPTCTVVYTHRVRSVLQYLCGLLNTYFYSIGLLYWDEQQPQHSPTPEGGCQSNLLIWGGLLSRLGGCWGVRINTLIPPFARSYIKNSMLQSNIASQCIICPSNMFRNTLKLVYEMTT